MILANSNDNIFLPIFLIITIPILAFLSLYLVYRYRRKKYEKYVMLHSISIRALFDINNKYKFKNIPEFNLEYYYDNENFYNEISCLDFLTYELVYLKNKIITAIRDASANNEMLKDYVFEIKHKCTLGEFDEIDPHYSEKILKKIEKKMYLELVKVPVVSVSAHVRLILTNINGVYRARKEETFNSNEILHTISLLSQKRGNYYTNEDVWKSLCRVERGKVSNKMRFAIYERDGYRCCKCGRHTNDLEIDHIFPIAKGGKSTFDNLQTLCHRCNYQKSDRIE